MSLMSVGHDDKQHQYCHDCNVVAESCGEDVCCNEQHRHVVKV